MPASVDQVQSQRTLAVADPRYVQRSLLAAAVILVHVIALLLMAKLPWFSPGAKPEKVEHHFVLRQPTEPRLIASPVQRLQPMPIESLNDHAFNQDWVSLKTRRRTTQEKSRVQNSIYAALGDHAVDGGPPFIAGSSGGSTDWQQFRRAADAHRPPETFDDLLSQLGNDGLELAIVFDSTASMDREIAAVKDGIQRIAKTLFRLVPKTRVSLCTYRDQGDDYVAKGLKLSASAAQMSTFLSEVRAQGGGDRSESVTAGLRWVLENNRFRRNAKKVILIFGDAPPKPDQMLACQRLVADFRFGQRGTVSTVTCHRRTKLQRFVEIAEIGGGESFLNNDETRIVEQLLVSVFGTRYEDELLLRIGLR